MRVKTKNVQIHALRICALVHKDVPGLSEPDSEWWGHSGDACHGAAVAVGGAGAAGVPSCWVLWRQ